MPRKNHYQWNTTESNEQNEQPSRSQKKRDSTALQVMGEEVAALSDNVLESLPVSPLFKDAVRELRRFSSHESRRRQLQYIGRLMREETDVTALRDALDALKTGHAEGSAAFKRAERVRDTLMTASTDDIASLLLAFLPKNEDVDRAQVIAEIQELVQKARNEREHKRPPHAFRALFRRLREVQAD